MEEKQQTLRHLAASRQESLFAFTLFVFIAIAMVFRLIKLDIKTRRCGDPQRLAAKCSSDVMSILSFPELFAVVPFLLIELKVRYIPFHETIQKQLMPAFGISCTVLELCPLLRQHCRRPALRAAKVKDN